MASKNHMRIRKSKQVSFKVTAAVAQSIEAASRLEDLPLADFVRKVLLWACGQYEAVGSLRMLRLLSLPDELIEKTFEEEREALHQHRTRLKQQKRRVENP
jgi:hypothetical protein